MCAESQDVLHRLKSIWEIMHTFAPHVMFADLKWLEDYSRHFKDQPDALPLPPGTADTGFLNHLEKIKRDCAKEFPMHIIIRS